MPHRHYRCSKMNLHLVYKLRQCRGYFHEGFHLQNWIGLVLLYCRINGLVMMVLNTALG